VDPLGFDGADVNLYRYVGNSPQDARDVLGLLSIAIDDDDLTPPVPTPVEYDDGWREDGTPTITKMIVTSDTAKWHLTKTIEGDCSKNEKGDSHQIW
jgi:hypothetical protein